MLSQLSEKFWERERICFWAIIVLMKVHGRVDRDEYHDGCSSAGVGGSFQVARLTGEGGRVS